MLNSITTTLLENFQPLPKAVPTNDRGVTVSQTVSAAAVLYEAARNAVEFRAEHLIRRAAVERILKRRILTRPSGEGIAETLIKELLWARYLENGSVLNNEVEEIQKTIEKYIALREGVVLKSDWILGVASCEIEKKLSPSPNREALINFVYQTLRDRITLNDDSDQKTKNIQVYIAVHRAFAQSDKPVIRFHLLLSYFPNWISSDRQSVPEIIKHFSETYKEIESQLCHPLGYKLSQFVKKEAAPFFVIRDIANENPQEFPKLILDPEIISEAAKRLLKKRYAETGARIRRAAARSIIYIFLTKMVFTLILEIPFDRFLGKTNYFAIAVNTLFPPFLMFLLTASISLPDKENTTRVVEKINQYLYGDDTESTKIKIGLADPIKKSVLSTAFTVIYFLTFILIFGFIFWLLFKMGFNIVSMTIFLFFLTVVSFFAYRVRLSTKDYVIKEKESATAPIADFLSLPILRVGSWLSTELTQINFLIFILDFMIEAPFKAFFQVIEEWIHFVRMKKEEIIS